MKNIHAASQLLGHTEDEIRKTVYVRVGAVVKPVKQLRKWLRKLRKTGLF